MMANYEIWLDGEKCNAYGDFTAENLTEAKEVAISRMYDATDGDGWEFRIGNGNHIDMYWCGDWQNTVSVWEGAI